MSRVARWCVLVAVGLAVNAAASRARGDAPATPPPADLPRILTSCTQLEKYAHGVEIGCDGAALQLEEYTDVGFAEVAEIKLDFIRAAGKESGALVTTTDVPFPVAKLHGKAFEAIAKTPDGTVAFKGFIVAAQLSEARARVVMCMPSKPTGTLDVCRAVVPTYVELGPGGVAPGLGLEEAPSPSPATFRGKRFTLPAGCTWTQQNGATFRAQCGDAISLNVRRLNSDGEVALVTTRDGLLKAIPGATYDASATRKCKLGGVATKCESIVVGDDAIFWLGTATVDKAPLIVQCGQPKTQKDLARLCAKILTF